MSIDSETLQQTVEFKKNHFENADFEYWQVKTSQLFHRLQNLKDQKKKDRCILELYTTYLQMTEILFINIYAQLSKIENFISALFINNRDLRDFIEKNFLSKSQIFEIFIECYAVAKHHKTDDLIKDYNNLLPEVSKDYLENFDLLNSFKHGYRINAKNEKTVLSIGNGKQNFKINETDSTMKYFCKNKDQIVYERKINFNNGRIFGKALFVSALLENLRAAALFSMGVKTKAGKFFYIEDKEKWNKSFGESSFNNYIFQLAKQK